MNRTYIGFISAAVVMAIGCSGRERNQAESHYRALLLPYVQKGASVAAVAHRQNDGYWALLSPAEGHADRLSVLSVRESAVEPFDEIALPDRLKAICPEKDPALFQASVALALAPNGHGLLLARFGCGKDPIGAVWFERVGGRFVSVEQVDTMLPDHFRPSAIACASAGVCYFSFNRRLAPATPEGPSSISVARWRQAHFDALLLNEEEAEDDRFFELRSLVAGANTVMVAAVETSSLGNGTSRDLSRMFLLRDERVDPVTGQESFGMLTAEHASAHDTFVLGASTDDERTAALEVSPTAEVKVLARLSAVPDGLRTHLALLDARVLDVFLIRSGAFAVRVTSGAWPDAAIGSATSRIVETACVTPKAGSRPKRVCSTALGPATAAPSIALPAPWTASAFRSISRSTAPPGQIPPPSTSISTAVHRYPRLIARNRTDSSI